MTVLYTLQRIAVEWGIRCFGREHVQDRGVRALRFAEEAVELAQACHVTEDKMRELVKVVYSRPRGDTWQEFGGCMVTLSVLGHALNHGLEEAFADEVSRCLSKTPEHFAARNKEKLELGLTG